MSIYFIEFDELLIIFVQYFDLVYYILIFIYLIAILTFLFIVKRLDISKKSD